MPTPIENQSIAIPLEAVDVLAAVGNVVWLQTHRAKLQTINHHPASQSIDSAEKNEIKSGESSEQGDLAITAHACLDSAAGLD